MSNKFKLGDRVIPKKGTLKVWGDDLTIGKVYKVVPKKTNRDMLVVYDDGGEQFWETPDEFFERVYDKVIAGGKLL